MGVGVGERLVLESDTAIPSVAFLRRNCSRDGSHPHRFNELATVQHTPTMIPVDVLFCICLCQGKWLSRADRPAGKATISSGLCLGRSEMLRSLKHYLRAQSWLCADQGRRTIDRLEKRGVERGSALKGREIATLNETTTGTVSKATVRKFLRDGLERILAFKST